MTVRGFALHVDEVLSLDRGFEELSSQLRGLGRQDRRRLLEEVGPAAQDKIDHAERTVECYLALHDDLDLTDRNDAQLSRRLLESSLPRDESLAAVARAVRTSPAEELHPLALVVEAQCLATTGEVAAACDMLRREYDGHYGTGSLGEFEVGLAMGQMASIRGDYGVALLLARRAEFIATRLGRLRAVDHCAVSLRVYAALKGLRAPIEQRRQYVDRLDRQRREYFGDRRRALDRYSLAARAELAAESGQEPLARSALQSLKRSLEAGRPGNWTHQSVAALEFTVESHLGNYEAALGKIHEIRGRRRVVINPDVVLAGQEALVLARLNRRDEAEEQLTNAVDRLRTSSLVPFKTLFLASSLAEIARESLGEASIERSALEIGAEAGLHWMAQARGIIQDYPLLFEPCEVELRGHRARFAEDHRRLRQHIADRIVATPGLREEFLAGRDCATVCAWCQGVLLDGEWVPVGHLFAASPNLRVTHGICPSCEAQLRQ